MGIRIEGLAKTYGSFTALKDLSLTVPPGTIFGLLGCNGSGKATTLNLLAGLLEPTAGRVWVHGHELRTEPLLVKRSLGVLPEDQGLFELLTVHEHLLLACSAYEVPRAEAGPSSPAPV